MHAAKAHRCDVATSFGIGYVIKSGNAVFWRNGGRLSQNWASGPREQPSSSLMYGPPLGLGSPPSTMTWSSQRPRIVGRVLGWAINAVQQRLERSKRSGGHTNRALVASRCTSSHSQSRRGDALAPRRRRKCCGWRGHESRQPAMTPACQATLTHLRGPRFWRAGDKRPAALLCEAIGW